jgi:hypothetical protein
MITKRRCPHHRLQTQQSRLPKALLQHPSLDTSHQHHGLKDELQLIVLQPSCSPSKLSSSKSPSTRSSVESYMGLDRIVSPPFMAGSSYKPVAWRQQHEQGNSRLIRKLNPHFITVVCCPIVCIIVCCASPF